MSRATILAQGPRDDTRFKIGTMESKRIAVHHVRQRLFKMYPDHRFWIAAEGSGRRGYDFEVRKPEETEARFWDTSPNGEWVRLKIRPLTAMRCYATGEHDEGWWSEGLIWTHEGDRITRDSVSDGTDCDGRLSRYHTDAAGIRDLRARYVERASLAAPEWQEEHASQRDYSAEAMGY